MPRKRRLYIPGLPQHVVQRGVDRQAVFFSEADCARYLDTFQLYAEPRNIALHAYCLMTNHVHLLVSAREEGDLSCCMQDLGRKFVATTNRAYKRTGGLWEGRFYSSYLEPNGFLLNCMRYIELNPIRANIVTSPERYRWSSFLANAGTRTNSLVTHHPAYLALGDNQASRAKAYLNTFNHEPEGFTTKNINQQIRTATQQGALLAGSAFAKQVADKLGYSVIPSPRGWPRKSA